MFRRLRWMFIGAAAGLAAYVWARGKAQDARGAVPEAGQEFAAKARVGFQDMSARLIEALREGRVAMAEREESLKREILGNGSRG